MPTVIAMDCSASMHSWSAPNKEGNVLSKLKLASECGMQILEFFAEKMKLEHLAVLSFSSDVEKLSEFSRDYAHLKLSIAKMKVRDKSLFSQLVSYLNQFVVETWGYMEPCHIIIITDGRLSWPEDITIAPSRTLFEFPGNLHILCLESTSSLTSSGCMTCLKNILEQNSGKGSITSLLKSRLNEHEVISTMKNELEKFLNDRFKIFEINLKCGSLSSQVALYPAPVADKTGEEFDDSFQIVGFLDVADVGNPPVLSRHLLSPVADKETSQNPDETKDFAGSPAMAIVLHGSLKIENKVALVKVSPNNYGVIYSWPCSKTKSNLVLSLLPPGAESVPWLGNIRQLGPSSLLPSTGKKIETPTFPVQPRKGSKRSYAQPTVAWTRPTGLQTDIQKILRSAKKLPEKSQVFYKDLNRLRRAALAFGFHELLEGISSLLERECTLLPGTAQPEAMLQLSHAARELKASVGAGYEHNLEPLKTDFKFNR
ncbi:integrator complex subunit 14-like [Clavelina lepadiformis]|uniref:integrator complex subunit 14-like n=1 Tax=Clavelina lepadiformis TaxID=159417 RepID=UPI00404237B5